MKLLLLAILPILSFADEAPFNQERLDKTVSTYQHVLQLDDWRTDSKFVDEAEIQATVGGPAWAASYEDDDLKIIHIIVLSPDEYATSPHSDWSVERINADIVDSILHELIHARLHDMSLLFQKTLEKVKDKKLRKLLWEEETFTEERIVVRLTTAILNSTPGSN